MVSDKVVEKKRNEGLCSRIVFVITTCLILVLFYFYWNAVLIPRWDTTAEWDVSRIVQGFYELPEDSVSVLLLGDSHMVSGISAGQLAYEHGIPAYSCATAGQTVFGSYYWLKEALRFQSPEVVLFDVDMLFQEEHFEKDGDYRKVFDYMKASSVKAEAIRMMSDEISKKETMSYFFPILRYHDRWKELDAGDFRNLFADKTDENLGFLMMNTVSEEAPGGIDSTEQVESVPFAQSAYPYLEKMKDLCEQEEIDLILVKTPYSDWTPGMNAAVKELAQEMGLAFWDYNDRELMQQCGLTDAKMYSDKNHLNLFGAERLTQNIAQRLKEKKISNKGYATEYFEKLKEGYYYNLESKQLPFISNEKKEELFAILNKNQNDYTIFALGCSESFAFTDDSTKQMVSELGFENAFQAAEKEGYVGISEGGVLRTEESSAETICLNGMLTDGTEFTLEVNGLNGGGYSKIEVGAVEKEFAEGGINFYVYDNINHEFVCVKTMY